MKREKDFAASKVTQFIDKNSLPPDSEFDRDAEAAFRMFVGNFLRIIREDSGLSLNATGFVSPYVSVNQIKQLENGVRLPSERTFHHLMKLYGTSADETRKRLQALAINFGFQQILMF